MGQWEHLILLLIQGHHEVGTQDGSRSPEKEAEKGRVMGPGEDLWHLEEMEPPPQQGGWNDFPVLSESINECLSSQSLLWTSL